MPINASQSCESCGVAVTPTTSFLTESGVVCASCLQLREANQRDEQAAATARDAAQLGRASRLGWLHGVNWATAFLLLSGWADVPGWLTAVLVAGVLALGFALALRSRLAFRMAVALDTAGALALLVASVIQLDGGRFLFLLFPVVFAGWLAWLTWRARNVFEAR